MLERTAAEQSSVVGGLQGRRSAGSWPDDLNRGAQAITEIQIGVEAIARPKSPSSAFCSRAVRMGRHIGVESPSPMC